MHSKSDNTEAMIYDDVNEVIKDVFASLLSRYQIGLEKSMRGCDFIVDGVNLLYYKYHKMSFKRAGSYTESLD